MEGNRSRGRPRAEWIDNIREWTKMKQYNDLVKTAQNREKRRVMQPTFRKKRALDDDDINKKELDIQYIKIQEEYLL